MKILNGLLAMATLAVGLHAMAAQAAPVINQILISEESFYLDFVPVFGAPSKFVLSDGSSLNIGHQGFARPFTGSADENSLKILDVKVQDGNIYYTFDSPKSYPPGGGYNLIDQLAFFITSDHDVPYSVSGRFEAYSPLVLIAEEGSTKAKLSGYAKLVENNNVHYDYAWYDDHEINFAAPIGSLVYYELDFNISWWRSQDHKHAFTTDFFEPPTESWDNPYPYIEITGKIDFTNVLTPVPEPSAYAMLGIGLGILGYTARRRKLV